MLNCLPQTPLSFERIFLLDKTPSRRFHACMSNTIAFFGRCVEPPKLAATGIYSLQWQSGKRLYRDGWFSLSFHNGTEWQQIAANIAGWSEMDV